MSARLIPQFAYSANPYLAALNAQMYAQWGFPDLYYPAAPVGFMGYSPDLATLYVTNLPNYVYYPSLFNSLGNLIFVDPRKDVPVIPYATTAEVMYNSQYGLVDAAARETLTTAAAISTIAATYFAAKRVGGPLLFVGKRIPLVGGLLSAVEEGFGALVGERGILTSLLRTGSHLPLIGGLLGRGAGALARVAGSNVLAGLLGWTIGFTGAELLAGLVIDKLIIEPTADVIRDTHRIRTSLGRLLIGSEDFLPITGGLTSRAAHEIYRDLLKIYRDEITVDYSDIMAVLTAGTQVGLFEQIGPNKERIVQVVKTLSHYLRIISEIARDPSLVDTIKNVAQLANAGIAVEQAPMVYRQMAVQATAGGYALSNLWPVAQQVGQFYQQLGLAPATGMILTPSAFTTGRIINQTLYGMGLGATAASLGGTEGIAQMHLASFGQNVAANPVFQYMLLRGQGGALGELKFSGPVDVNRYFIIQAFMPEVAEQTRRYYGDAFTANLDYALKLKHDFLDSLNIPDEAKILILIQMGVPKDIAIMAVIGQGQLRNIYAQRAYRERQAEIMDILNETELRSEGLLTMFERLKRSFKTGIRSIISGEFLQPLHEELETLRYRFRFGGTTAFERFIGYILVGKPPVETGAPLTYPEAVRIKEGEYYKLLKDLRTEELVSIPKSELESLFIEDLSSETKWEKLFSADMSREVKYVPALGILDAAVKRGEISFKGLTLGESMRLAERYLKNTPLEWNNLSETEKRQVSRYVATKWKEENNIPESELPQIRKEIFREAEFANIQAKAQKLKTEAEQILARVEEQFSRDSEALLKTTRFGWVSRGIRSKSLVSENAERTAEFLRKEIESYLIGGKSSITAEDLKEIGVKELRKDLTPQEQALEYVKEYLRAVSEGESYLSPKAVIGRQILIQKGVIDPTSRFGQREASILYREIFGEEGAYWQARQYRKLIKRKELAERVIESVPYAILGEGTYSEETKDLIKSTFGGNQELILAYKKILEISEGGITEEEVSGSKKEISKIRNYLLALRESEKLDKQEKKQIDSLLKLTDRELAQVIASRGNNAIFTDIESQKAEGVRNVIVQLKDFSDQLKITTDLLKDLNNEIERARRNKSFNLSVK